MTRIQYGKRDNEPFLFRVCECGHTWGHHGYRGWLDWFSDGPCKTCMCPRYKQIGDFTWEQLQEYVKE